MVDTKTWTGTTWALFVGPYLYIGRSLCDMIKQVVIEWKDDRHLVG